MVLWKLSDYKLLFIEASFLSAYTTDFFFFFFRVTKNKLIEVQTIFWYPLWTILKSFYFWTFYSRGKMIILRQGYGVEKKCIR